MARDRTRGGGRRSDYHWSALAVSITALDIAPGTSSSSSAVLTVENPGTIVRLRGALAVQLDATAADERACIAVGVQIVDAVQATFAEPFTNRHSGNWMWIGFFNVSSLAEGAVAFDGMFDRQILDSKAMRKVKPFQRVVVTAEAVTSTDQGGTVDLIGGLTCLFAE